MSREEINRGFSINDVSARPHKDLSPAHVATRGPHTLPREKKILTQAPIIRACLQVNPRVRNKVLYLTIHISGPCRGQQSQKLAHL